MLRGFFNGLLAGSILGAITYMFMAPAKKQMFSPKMLAKSRRVRKRAGRIVAQVSDGVKDISNILKK
jgi:gas vesicle protein